MPGDGVALVEVKARRTAVIAAATAWEDFPSLWPRLLDEVYAFVRRCPEFAAVTAATPGPHWHNIMLYRDHNPNVEVGVLAPTFVSQGRVIASELPGGRAAAATHRGSPQGIGETHDAVRAFVRSQGLDGTGVVWEVYGHPDEDSGAFTTEVFHLVA